MSSVQFLEQCKNRYYGCPFAVQLLKYFVICNLQPHKRALEKRIYQGQENSFETQYKPTRVHLPEKLRTRCTYCDGTAEKRDLCVHEVKLIAEIRSRREYMKLTSTMEEVGNETEEQDFSENEDESELSPVYYTSPAKQAILRLRIE